MADSRADKGATTVLIFEWVTGGGLVGQAIPPSLAAEGAAIRRALVADFAAVAGVQVIEAVDARCLDPGLDLPNIDRIITDPTAPIDLAALVSRSDRIVIVAPETDGVLADLARQVEALGGSSLGSTPAAIMLGSDKLQLAEHLVQEGIPTPPTWSFCPADGWPVLGADRGRFVVKPVDGAGSVDTFVLPNQTSCPPAWMGRSGGIVQPFRAGSALSASFLVGRDGHATLLAVGSQNNEVGFDGQITHHGGEVPVPCEAADLAPVRQAVESIPGLFGLVGVDFIRVEPTGSVEVIEINPRVTTSIVGLIHLAPPGTIARAWLNLVEPADGFDMAGELGKIATAPPVRFAADGLILHSERQTR